MKLLLATTNSHKRKEFERLFELNNIRIHIVIPSEIGFQMPEIDESGDSFAANAYIKAKTLYDLTGLPTLADDSGLCVDALNGNPGIYSARYAGETATDADNRTLLKDNILSAGISQSSGRFVAALCVCDSIRTIIVEGECQGTIITEEKGEKGFGYDSMFIPTGYDRTFAELESDVKHQISHRARALHNLVEKMRLYEYL